MITYKNTSVRFFLVSLILGLGTLTATLASADQTVQSCDVIKGELVCGAPHALTPSPAPVKHTGLVAR